MFDRKEEKVNNAAIWLNIDFETIKRRVNGITQKLEAVQHKFELQNLDNSGKDKK